MRAFTGVAAVLALAAGRSAADDPKAPADRPVDNELTQLKEQFAKKAPPGLVGVYEKGVEDVRTSGVMDKAIKVGDKAPAFDLPDATGKTVKLADLLAKGPVVLTWYRGGWCPYCNIQLRGLQKELPAFNAAGATVVAVSPETPDNSLTTAEKNKLAFVVLSDKGNRVARQYGVAYTLPAAVAASFKGRLDLAKFNGDDSNELPLAATYVVGPDGVVRYAFVDADYRKTRRAGRRAGRGQGAEEVARRGPRASPERGHHSPTTSPPLMVPNAPHVPYGLAPDVTSAAVALPLLMLLVANRTDPSAMRTVTPPVW